MFLTNLVCLIYKPLLGYLEHSLLNPYLQHSFPVSISRWRTLIIAFHESPIIFLRPLPSNPPMCSSLLTAWYWLLSPSCRAGRRTFTVGLSPIHAVFWICFINHHILYVLRVLLGRWSVHSLLPAAENKANTVRGRHFRTGNRSWSARSTPWVGPI